jgi:signal transduction histidine kinase
MTHHLHGKIQSKFLLGLAGIFLLLGGIFLFSLNMHLREMLHIEAEAKAELVFAHLSSVQEYVRDILRPTVRQALPKDQFLLEAMSTSFVTRKVLVDLSAQRDQYLYRRVALFPRNPASQANDMERGLIRHFQENPEATTYRGYRVIDGVEHFVMARPVHFERECLTCHGDPKDAPRVLIGRYGAERGFGRKENELAGLDFVGMPVEKSVQHIRQSITLFGGSFFAVAAGVFLLIVIFFNRLVVTNLRRLSGIFRENFTSPKDQSILDRLDEGDEIHSLLEAFGAFAAHLRAARSQLEDYAANLEDKVRCRTADLTQEAAEHKTDVRLFVELLGDLNRSQDHSELLKSALPRIAERFGAARAAYLCAPLGRQQYAWPGPDCETLMPKDWVRVVNAGQVRLEDDRVFVPVSTSDFNRGLMGLFWEGGRPEIAPEVLLALGQQLGIAIENLEAIDALLRQNRLLELIFEGISDPLLLVDEGGSVVFANSSARALAEGIRPGSRIGTWLASIAAPAGKDGPRPAAIAGAIAKAIVGPAPSGLEFELANARTLAFSVYPLRDGGGMGRAVVYIRETTAEKRLRAQMQQSEKLAALGRLAAGLAHEINNPLGVISCYAQLLQKSQQGSQAQEDLEVIVRHTKKAQKVLQDLLGLARANKSATGPSDLNAVARDLAQIFRVQVDKTGVALELELAEGLPRVAAEASTLEQILTNLLVNAFDAVAPETGRITVATAPAAGGAGVVLRVADNGPGIAPEHIGQLFDPFFTTKEIGKGTGLGLTVVHELMRELGGEVEVRSEGGAIFLLTFPAARPDVGQSGAAAADAAARP